MLRSQLSKELASTEKRRLESEGNVYALVQTVDVLERLFVQGALNKREYDAKLEELAQQYKAAVAALGSSEELLERLFQDAQYARARLAALTTPDKPTTTNLILILESGQHFVTLVDALKMGLVHADELTPVVRDLVRTLDGIPGLPANIPTVVKLWLTRLQAMKATDALAEADVRQLDLDLVTAFANFHQAVKNLASFYSCVF